MAFDNALDAFKFLLSLDESKLTENLAKYIDPSCDIYGLVYELIAAHKHNKQQTSIMSLIADQAATLVDDDSILQLNGQQVGIYKLTKKLGRGGMGAVYLGERNDGQLEQQVAIKLVYPSITALMGEQVLLNEAQHLANLHHSNIAQIYHVDSLVNGTSYMVMEYVDGIPIDIYAQNNNLSTNSLLDLFYKVCAAVIASHNNMVIHADIKPSNILVNQAGEPKLMDFGVAKQYRKANNDNENLALEIDAASLEYASPEQLKRERLTIASDIFSLGKLLEKLLARTQLNKGRELTEVVETCCREKIAERYQSVTELSADIQSIIHKHPISQLRRNSWYVAKKRVSRNPALYATGLLLLLTVLSFSVSLFIKNKDLTQQKIKAEKIADFMVSVFDISNPYNSENFNIQIKDVLLSTKSKLVDFENDQHKTNNSLRLALAQAYVGTGLYQPAVDLLSKVKFRDNQEFAEIEYWLAMADFKVGKYAESLARVGGIATDYQSFDVNILRARCLRELGEVSQSTYILSALLQDDISVADEVTIYLDLAENEYLEADFNKSLEYATKAHTIYFEHGLTNQILLSDVYYKYGGALEELGNIETVEEIYSKKLTLDQKLFGGRHPKMAETYNLMSYFYLTKGNYELSITYAEQAIDLHQQYSPKGSGLYLDTLFNKASALSKLARTDKAIEQILFAEQLCRNFLPQNHLRFAIVYNALGSLYMQAMNYNDAQNYLYKAKETLSNSVGEHDQLLNYILNNLAKIEMNNKNFPQAIALYTESLTIAEKMFGRQGRDVAQTMKKLGSAYRRNGQTGKALLLLKEALELATSAYGEGHARLTGFYYHLAQGQKATGDIKAALSLQLHSVYLSELGYGEENTISQSMRVFLAQLYLLNDDARQAFDLANRAFQFELSTNGAEHPKTLKAKQVMEQAESELKSI